MPLAVGCSDLLGVVHPCKSTLAFDETIYLNKILVVPKIIMLEIYLPYDIDISNDQEFLMVV